MYLCIRWMCASAEAALADILIVALALISLLDCLAGGGDNYHIVTIDCKFCQNNC